MIRLDNVYKSFPQRKNSKKVLKGLSFQADPGEVFCLLGANGSGKTTTLQTIATLLKPDSGQVYVNEMNVAEKGREVRSVLGFLTGEMRLAGSLTGREWLNFFGKLNKMKPDSLKAKISLLADHLEMEDFLDKPVDKLSTGMKQKISIAISQIHDPLVILFDEPTSGLDIMASRIVLDYIKQCRSEGKTIILCTHIMSEAEKLGDRIGILIDGKLAAQGTLDELLAESGESSLEDLFFKLSGREEQ
ncbi:ABC transporter ATP-binding protein [Spirochaeta isovalerica]|uniref:Sodium transport system ATP-binding protein n=1 Tax=Spirochaeta isovalerica TaxID=150 RepID=A0A841RA89_9SPIO|nr:ATP-binding cassette domain-containing protein [Spirochaeta isovalerica]MBB6480656.1 sodium transport system ATP-binding protein [Spirochaeta isovalerica]